ncbi:MAG: DUF3108 domain-containing protein [Formosimonas sp.]
MTRWGKVCLGVLLAHVAWGLHEWLHAPHWLVADKDAVLWVETVRESSAPAQVAEALTPAQPVALPTPKLAQKPPKPLGIGEAESAKPAASAALKRGAPLDVSMDEAGFAWTYSVWDANHVRAQGQARLLVQRTGERYQAVLSLTSALAHFNWTSRGVVRRQTLASESFKFGGRTKFLNADNHGFGGTFAVDYAAWQISFSRSEGKVSALTYDTVFDPLSALLYVQAALHSKKGRVPNVTVPMALAHVVTPKSIQLGAAQAVTVGERHFAQAVPVRMVMPEAGIDSLTAWLAPEVDYRPVRIEIAFAPGKVSLEAE